ncbi:MAG: response regulator [Elusimicrobiota bacterium]|nr:response regulator [Elusimicrobiota bacterium]
MPKILVVDDDPDCVEMLSIHLKRRGYTVVGANDAPNALERAAYDRPDLILLDVRMPSVDGFRITEILRSNELTELTPIVLMSAAGKMWATRRLVPDPTVRFIEKPLDFDALDALCALLIRPRGPSEGFPS